MIKVCAASVPQRNASDSEWQVAYLRKIGAACALLCGSSAFIGVLTFLDEPTPDCLLCTAVLACAALAGLAAAVRPSEMRKLGGVLARRDRDDFQ